jgi:hypothetical protein
LPYHLKVTDYLKTEERELWNWFASAKAKADYAENLRLDLLKSTYRLDAADHPDVHKILEEAKAGLHLEIPVTLYQAQNSPQPNASLFYISGQGHIVFSGPVFSLLSPDEMKSVIGHELAHYHLWEREGGDFHIADRLLDAVAHDARAAASHEQTARRYQLYTEIFADRGSLFVTGNADPVISGLVKIETGLSQVSAASYLKQADEIFSNGSIASEGVSHPETFIRARALGLWQQQAGNADPQISAMIEGKAKIDELDLPGQRRLASATRRLVEYLLKPKWFQTPATLAHAKLYFEDFEPVTNAEISLPEDCKPADNGAREYLSYVLLDFAKADPELEEVPLAAALDVSRQLEFEVQFEKLAARELKMKLRDLRRIKEQAAELLAKAEANYD